MVKVNKFFINEFMLFNFVYYFDVVVYGRFFCMFVIEVGVYYIVGNIINVSKCL